MLRIKGNHFNGCTVSEALVCLASDPANNELLNKAFIVIRNGALVLQNDFEKVLISADDEITIMPLIAGG
jgi:sulfur carrier protein ThiS